MTAGSPVSAKPRHARGFSFVGTEGRGRGGWRRADMPQWILGIALGVLYVAALVVFRHHGMYTDEVDHFSQITLFLRGDFRILENYLTTIPGYHALVAAILWTCGADSLNAARLVNAAFGLVAAAGFHALRRRLWPGTETVATAQFLVVPFLVPLFFLVYTDILALALILWATVFSLSGRHWLSVLLLSALVCVRQHEVIWAGFLAVVVAWPLWIERGIGAWRALARTMLPYALPLAGFLGFWWWNGAISLSQEQAALHPLSLHAGNVYLALILAGGLLPLHVLVGLRQFGMAVQRRPWLLALPVLIFAGFWWGFHADNPYNTVDPWYYIRNGFLLAVQTHPAVRALVGMLAAFTACGLAFTRLKPAQANWLYPFAALFLAASWLIEQRYVLVPFVLWLAFREQRSRTIEYVTLALWLVLAVCVLYGIIIGRFFL